MDESSILAMSNGGEMYVSELEENSLSAAVQSGAILYTNTTVLSSATVLSGITMATTKGNIMQVFSGGSALDTEMGSKTYMYVSDGGYVSGVYLPAGATLTVNSGGVVTDVIQEGKMIINNGAIVDGTVATLLSYDADCAVTVNSGGVLKNAVYAGNVTVNSGGLITSGSFADGLTVNSGGSATQIYVYAYTTFATGADVNGVYLGSAIGSQGGELAAGSVNQVLSNVYLDEGGKIEKFIVQGSGSRGYISEYSVLQNGRVTQACITGSARNLHAVNTGKSTSLYVASGGEVYDSIFDGSGIFLYANSSALVRNCTATNSAIIILSGGATGEKINLTSGGTLKISGTGAVLRGLTTDSTAVVNALMTAKFGLDFDMGIYDGGTMITDLCVIGASQRTTKKQHFYYYNYDITYSVTLDEVITGGVYKLAGGLIAEGPLDSKGTSKTTGLLDDKTFTLYAADGGVLKTDFKTGSANAYTDSTGTKYTLDTVKTGETYELQLTVSNVETPSMVVTTEKDVVDAHDNLISFQEAYAYAKRCGGGTITFDSSLQGKDITIPTLPEGSKNISIDASGISMKLEENTTYTSDTTFKNADIKREVTSTTDSYLTNGISASANVTVDGETSLTLALTDEQSSGLVIGAARVNANGNYVQSGVANLTITKGTFGTQDGDNTKYNIYGGAVGIKYGYANDSSVGGTCITIDATSDKINIYSNIFAGGAGRSKVLGDSQIIFKGTGTNLTVTGYVLGDSSFAKIGGTFASGTSYVQGDKIITFDGFTGDFAACAIRAFDKAEFSNAANVNFTNAKLDFSAISNWNFSDGSTAEFANGITNSFAGDTFNLSGEYGNSTTIIDANSESALAGFDELKTVNLFGTNATWSATESAWMTSSYKLELDTANNDIVLSKLA